MEIHFLNPKIFAKIQERVSTRSIRSSGQDNSISVFHAKSDIPVSWIYHTPLPSQVRWFLLCILPEFRHYAQPAWELLETVGKLGLMSPNIADQQGGEQHLLG
jgi:hypothetical protein